MTHVATCSRTSALLVMRSAVLAGLMTTIPVLPARAQSLPDVENGRYALAPVADGVVRLDTRSGSISSCSDKGTGWTCTAVPDERAALDAEIGRLQKDNEALRAQLAQPSSGKTGEALPKQDAPKPKAADGERKIEIPLPSDRDLDRMRGFAEQAWRRLVDMANRMQRDAGGRI